MGDRAGSQPEYFRIAEQVEVALQNGTPVVALESALITHGLPYPLNLEVARQMEAAVRQEGAVPATVGMIKGIIHIGLKEDILSELANTSSSVKVSIRDIATAIQKKENGGTTVAATMFVASSVGTRIMATGGIGGVHRENPFDVSADLVALASTPMVVISAGVKSVLDIPATLEYLETMSVPVVGYRTDEFPAFFSRASGMETSGRLDSPKEIAKFWETHHALGRRSSILIANPIPESHAIASNEIESIIEGVSDEARRRGIHGQDVTPFLLGRVAELSDQRSIAANVALLLNNARLAAQIAISIADQNNGKESQE